MKVHHNVIGSQGVDFSLQTLMMHVHYEINPPYIQEFNKEKNYCILGTHAVNIPSPTGHGTKNGLMFLF